MPGSLSPQQRLELIKLLNALPPTQFEELVFAMKPPSGVIPGESAPQGKRSAALLEWAESPTGTGLSSLEQILGQITAAGPELNSKDAQTDWVLTEILQLLKENQSPKYDLRGDQFTGGFAETVQGDPIRINQQTQAQRNLASARKTQPIRIFLAHASEDKDAVIDLYNRLKAKGFKPWLDKLDLLPGQSWRAEIPKAIRVSDVFIACLSKESIAKQGYIQREFRMALQKMGDMPPGKIYLIPVRLDDCQVPELRQEEYGINLTDYQWVDLFSPDGYEQLVRSIDYHFPGNPSQTSSDSTVIRETPTTVPQTLITEDPPKETIVISQERPKYDLRGAQFAGGFAETVLGNQVGGTIHNEPSESSRPTIETKAIDLGNGVTLELVHIPGGTFLMGSPEGEGYDEERPQHEVTIPEFWMGKYPVTQAQYRAFTDKSPSYFKGDNLPVERLSWYNAVEFCEKVSQKTGQAIRLPTEAEWEYACRAGTMPPYYFGDTLSKEQAKYKNDTTREIGKYPSNAFSLHDMHGNVWEWCQDHWHKNYEGAPANGSAWLTDNEGAGRLVRGGSWYDDPNDCRSAYRDDYYPADHRFNIGFRVVSVTSKALER